MCIPVIGAATAGIGTALDLSNNYLQEQQNQINAKENEGMALQAAADSIARGNREAALQRMAATQMIAEQRVGFATSGVDLQVGTAADVQASTRAISEVDARTTENNAAREAWGYKKTADSIKRQAALDKKTFLLRQVGTALGGTGRVASAGFSGGGG